MEVLINGPVQFQAKRTGHNFCDVEKVCGDTTLRQQLGVGELLI